MTGILQRGAAKRRAASSETGAVRGLLEAVVCLCLAVVIFRTFAVEGYIISTGSMAPALLGFHKRIVCPACGYTFAFGVPVDVSGSATAAVKTNTGRAGGSPSVAEARLGDVRCPNCGRDAIDESRFPANHGDQLLVQKDVYEFRNPRRWEVVVLRSVDSRAPPFVKRVVGLPNESLQIVDGEIVANGILCRKDLGEQRAVRIPVYDHDFPPSDVRDRLAFWHVERDSIQSFSGRSWQASDRGFKIDSPDTAAKDRAPESISWLAFSRHVRRGGNYQTAVALDSLGPGAGTHDAAQRVRLPIKPFPQLRVDSSGQRLVCTGALAAPERDRLFELNSDPAIRTVLERLDELSHQGPVTDDYGYNRANAGIVSVPVKDVALECDVRLQRHQGELNFEVADGRAAYRLVIDVSTGDVKLISSEQAEPLRSATLRPQDLASTCRIELSLFDRQVAAAIDGKSLFPAWECQSPAGEAPRTPIRIGACGTAAEVSSLKVYRDVYYTTSQGRNAVDRPFQLGPGEYFVLGDNSPVSRDARSWRDGAVKQSQLVGKPFFVHLPSRPGEVTLGGRTRYIRIPDFSRMRYIR